MVMPVNDSPLLGKVLDINQLSDQWRDGRKLRQEYDDRQHEKAMNELMAIDDYKERLNAARNHRYAGALVPMVEQYEEQRQKFALDNLKTNADIGKTYGETEKLYAESGKIGAETNGLQVDTSKKIFENLGIGAAASAISQDPRPFQLTIGHLYKVGQISEEQAATLLKMAEGNPVVFAQTLKAWALAQPDIAKAFAPQFKEVDLGDRKQVGSYDPMTGGFSGMEYGLGVSPDADLKAKTDVQVANINGEFGLQREHIQQEAQNARTQAQIEYQMQQDMLKNQEATLESFGGKVYVVHKNGSYYAATDENGNPITDTKQNAKSASHIKMENDYIKELQENAHTLQQVAGWIKSIETGELKLGLISNAGNTIAGLTGINALGSNPQKFKEFNSFIKDLAARALRLNAGVQTDNDYKRQLEALIGGQELPRDDATAIALLNKILRDFENTNKATYSQLRNLNAQFGVNLPEYGGGSSSGNIGSRLGDAIFK